MSRSTAIQQRGEDKESLFVRALDSIASLQQSPALGFLVRSFIRMLLVLTVLVVITFAMVRLVPGDPARKVVGLQGSPEAYAEARAQMHLDEPLFTQFISYISDLARLDFGYSFTSREPVIDVILSRAGSTIEIVLLAVVFVLLIAIPTGITVGVKSFSGRTWINDSFAALTGLFGALPHYLTGTLLVFLFAVILQVMPVGGSGGLMYAIMPALAMAIRPAAMLARVVRVETTGVLVQDYMRTARSKRLQKSILYVRHLVPNVLTPALAITGTLVAGLVSGAVIVEQVFARAGLGTALVEGVLSGDYPVVQGITLVLGMSVVLINVLVELLVALVDPRSRGNNVQ